jgi:hypothetical protein
MYIRKAGEESIYAFFRDNLVKTDAETAEIPGSAPKNTVEMSVAEVAKFTLYDNLELERD